MKIVFAGTPEFAAIALQSLIARRHEVALVLTQPDRPAGRGMRLVSSAVKQVAAAAGIEVAQPASLKHDAAALAQLRAVAADLMVVAAYGLILPQAVLDIPLRGCLNIHASLLPRWRGAAPIQRAIEAGDATSGVCIMRMEAGLDSGPLLLSRSVALAPDATAHTLHDTLATLGAALICQALDRLDSLEPVVQAETGVTYAHKIDKAEAGLDFRLPASVLERKVRAFDPFPGASATHAGAALKVWAADAEISTTTAAAGQILAADADGIAVACAQGSTLRITEMQRPGGKRLATRDFLRGFALAPGSFFDTHAAAQA